jgi:FtsP/CotA-like multicopper oxidase with cupredoxin domain
MFINRSIRVHPMHIHGFLFRVLSRSSGPVHPADRLCWKDTVGVLPNETVTVQAWFAPYAGRFVFHCHALEHADRAMMLQLEVVT